MFLAKLVFKRLQTIAKSLRVIMITHWIYANLVPRKLPESRRRLYEPEARAGLFIIMSNACLTEDSLNHTASSPAGIVLQDNVFFRKNLSLGARQVLTTRKDLKPSDTSWKCCNRLKLNQTYACRIFWHDSCSNNMIVSYFLSGKRYNM